MNDNTKVLERYEKVENSILNILTGNDTEYDRKLVSDWASQSEINQSKLELLQNIWKEDTWEKKLLNSEEIKQKVWLYGIGTGIKDKTENPNNMRKLHSYSWIRVVAVFVLVGIISVIVLTIHYTNLPDNTLAEVQNIVVKSNPAGQKSKIFLPDGSSVWLNAESSIQYTDNFSDSLRTVELSGEAFFEINRDTLLPFIVEANGLGVVVLGTKFNVNTFESNGAITVALTEGAVEVVSRKGNGVKERLNKSGQGIHYRPNDKKVLERFEFSIHEEINPISGWKDGNLIFDGDDFTSFVSKIRRWYGVQIEVIGDPPKDWEIRATFHEEYLSNVLNSISINKKFDFKLKRKKLVFMFH